MNQMITHDDRVLIYQIVRKPIKNTYIRLTYERVVVHAAPRLPEKVIRAHLDARFDRIYADWKQITPPLKDNEISLWGVNYQLVVKQGRFKVTSDGRLLTVSSLKTDIRAIKKQIWGHAIKNQLSLIRDQIKETIAIVGIRERPYRIKYLKSKFGSYHRRNDEITINSFLARLDPKYLFYVLMHEYAHVIVFNHSKDFYHVLDQLLPAHKDVQKQLKRCAIID